MRRLSLYAFTATISTHASLAGGDLQEKSVSAASGISTHASLAGGDAVEFIGYHIPAGFQPTPPSREATQLFVFPRRRLFISTHASLAGGDSTYTEIGTIPAISTHASLAGGDAFCCAFCCSSSIFQPTPPSREATYHDAGEHGFPIDFNPRLPRGRRHSSVFSSSFRQIFQPTPPSREATDIADGERGGSSISTHASLAGGDGETVLGLRRFR